MANRAPYYRIVFGLAARYNLGFGLRAGFAPRSFFHLLELTPPLYPALWRCIGMLVGTYGLAYGYAAWRPERAGSLLTGGAANGLSTLAGAILTLQTEGLRGWLLVWTWSVWAAGFALTGATLAGSVTAIAVFTGTLMILFCPWAAIMGRVLR